MNCSLSVTGLNVNLAEVSASVGLVSAGSSREHQLAPRATGKGGRESQ